MLKGQVSTEYLVILAVVLVVALVVVYLVGGFAGIGSGSLETQSKNYWASTSPFSIKTFSASGNTLQLDVVNNDLERLQLTDIRIGTQSVYNTNTTFDSGESHVLSASLSAPGCGPTGESYQYGDVTLIYSKGGITDIVQKGIKPLVGKCS